MRFPCWLIDKTPNPDLATRNWSKDHDRANFHNLRDASNVPKTGQFVQCQGLTPFSQLRVLLLLFPAGLGTLLGLPQTNTTFYPTILGEVIFGIGMALLVEVYGGHNNVHGLGLAGAIAINFIGGGILMLWLLFGQFDIPTRGRVILWSVAVIVLLIGIIEVFSKSWQYEKGTA